MANNQHNPNSAQPHSANEPATRKAGRPPEPGCNDQVMGSSKEDGAMVARNGCHSGTRTGIKRV